MKSVMPSPIRTHKNDSRIGKSPNESILYHTNTALLVLVNCKKELKKLGYYHGYKGYRFAGIAKNRLHLQSFEQISSLISFDRALKSSIYPRIIAVETALKNYTLEEILQDAESPFLDQIFAQSLNAYKECRGAKKQYKIELLRRLRLRNEMDSLLSQRYKSSVPVIQPFFDADKQVPSIFEVITLGTFGAFYKCLDSRVKQAIVQELNMPSNFNSASLLGDIIFTLKDLRNAVAHNGIVVDVRFKSNSVNQGIGKLLNGDSNITGINFNEITDYIVLLAYLLTKLQFARADRTKFLDDFLAILKEYRASLPQPIFSKLVSSQAVRKIQEARKFSDGND